MSKHDFKRASAVDVLKDECGNWLEYGGEHCYYLHAELDGEKVVLRIGGESDKEAAANAAEFLSKFDTGWRPVNW